MPSIQDILRPIPLTKVISQQSAQSSRLLTYFGMNPGGKNSVFLGDGRDGSYYVYNNVRTVGIGRAPGTAAGRRARNPVGRVSLTYARMHEQVALSAEEMHNLAKIDNPTTRDIAGADYIRRQTQTMGQRGANRRTALLIGMLRDSLYFHSDGDNWYPNLTSANALMQVSFQMPAGNKSKLNMLSAGDILATSWATTTTDIPLHIQQIDVAFQQLFGGRLGTIILTAAGWNAIIHNQYVATLAGTANPPMVQERAIGVGPDGVPITGRVGTINACPGITFFITDDYLDLGVPGAEARTKLVEDDHAIFCMNPAETDHYVMREGSEPIAEYDNGPITVKSGMAAWSKSSSNPTETELFQLDNALAINEIPASVAYGQIIY